MRRYEIRRFLYILLLRLELRYGRHLMVVFYWPGSRRWFACYLIIYQYIMHVDAPRRNFAAGLCRLPEAL
jgi:hypothetical protein